MSDYRYEVNGNKNSGTDENGSAKPIIADPDGPTSPTGPTVEGETVNLGITVKIYAVENNIVYIKEEYINCTSLASAEELALKRIEYIEMEELTNNGT